MNKQTEREAGMSICPFCQSSNLDRTEHVLQNKVVWSDGLGSPGTMTFMKKIFMCRDCGRQWFDEKEKTTEEYRLRGLVESLNRDAKMDRESIQSLESRLALAEELHKQADHFLKWRDNAADLGNAIKAFEQSEEEK